MAQVGDIVGGKYRLDRRLGEGGMGTVFEAENVNTGRRVAVKVLHGEWVTRPEVVRRFMHEARATTAIAHPNIVEVFDLDTDAARGVVYIVQELLLGETLEAYLAVQPERRMSVASALEVLLPLMSALVVAHGRGIVHRDIKPANIFLVRGRTGEMVPKLIDFGIAKDVSVSVHSPHNTQAGLALGTPSYMSPEQVAGLTDIDAQSDVWSLGVLLYEMLSGRLPYEASNANLILGKILYESPTPLDSLQPGLSSGVREIVHNCLQRDRAQRFRSVRAMLAAVLELEERPIDLRPEMLSRTELERSSRPTSPTVAIPELAIAPAALASQTIEAVSRDLRQESAPHRLSRRGVWVAGAFGMVGLALAVGWLMREPSTPRSMTAVSGPVSVSAMPAPNRVRRSPPVSPPGPVLAASPLVSPPAAPIQIPRATNSARGPASRPTSPVVRTRLRAAQPASSVIMNPAAASQRVASPPAAPPRASTPQNPRLRADEM